MAVGGKANELSEHVAGMGADVNAVRVRGQRGGEQAPQAPLVAQVASHLPGGETRHRGACHTEPASTTRNRPRLAPRRLRGGLERFGQIALRSRCWLILTVSPASVKERRPRVEYTGLPVGVNR